MNGTKCVCIGTQSLTDSLQVDGHEHEVGWSMGMPIVVVSSQPWQPSRFRINCAGSTVSGDPGRPSKGILLRGAQRDDPPWDRSAGDAGCGRPGRRLSLWAVSPCSLERGPAAEGRSSEFRVFSGKTDDATHTLATSWCLAHRDQLQSGLSKWIAGLLFLRDPRQS
jgi:hypothetical protein